MKNILLVEPKFPIPTKSKNHKNFFPIGLLKIASYLKDKGNEIQIFRGIPTLEDDYRIISKFNPSEIWVTSLFTYWAPYVKNTVEEYKKIFPETKIIVGGIYASLFSKEEVKNYTGCDEVIQGVIPEAEKYLPNYEIIKNENSKEIDYQIIHTSRGCNRKCKFCGTWKIEPEFISKNSIKNEILYKKLVFYDNNLLMNTNIEDILNELIDLKNHKKIKWCESQSGFDGRILEMKPYLGKMLKKAGFRYPRIAWDGKFEDYPKIKKQIEILVNSGYSYKDIYVFVLYNWDIPFEEMEEKRIKCWQWGVQIADCRFRPLKQLHDNYNPRLRNQTNMDYHINTSSGWTDELIKQFRKNVREQNICVRHGFPLYSRAFENKSIGKEIRRQLKLIHSLEDKIKFLDSRKIKYWIPDKIRCPIPITIILKENNNYVSCLSK